jgi:proliferating cell nuclear antigen
VGKILFKIKIANARFWKSLVGSISILVDEANFNVDEKGIRLRAMDPFHFAMVDFELPKAVFEEFVCDNPTKLCVNTNEMLKLLKRVGGDESIELNVDPKTARLNLILRSKYTRTFSMATLEATSEEAPTPKLSFNATIKVTTKFMKNAIEDASSISDNVQLKVTKERFVLHSKGDLGSVLIEVENGSEEILSLEVKEAAKATFNLKYLSDMIKAASNISDIVTVAFSTNMPIKLNFGLPQQGKLQYYLAPYKE